MFFLFVFFVQDLEFILLQDFMENAIGGVVTRASKDANEPWKDDLWVLRLPVQDLASWAAKVPWEKWETRGLVLAFAGYPGSSNLDLCMKRKVTILGI